ncbi:MAG: hypothetical protein V1848_01785 [Candidatus Magasanikbacteria bacterium]
MPGKTKISGEKNVPIESELFERALQTGGKKVEPVEKMYENSSTRLLAERLEYSIALSEKVMAQNKKIQNRMTLMTIASYIRLLLILIPIILGIIFLPGIIQGLLEQYKPLLEMGSKAGATGNGVINLLDLIKTQ